MGKYLSSLYTFTEKRMLTYKNISLKKYNTFGLDYTADHLVSIDTEDEIIRFFREKRPVKEPILILGGGSNILFTSDFKGTIINPLIGGISIKESYPDHVIVSAGAGIKWDTFVEWSVANGFGGVENLSLIPGSVGATPVQNIGAYGVEIKDYIEKVRTVCITDGSIKEFTNHECMFGYRNSIFKGACKGIYVVTRVYFRLNINPVLNPGYGSLKNEVNKLGDLSLRNIREAVINIRRLKLPDYEITGNAGSFFKNPVVKISFADKLKKIYPAIPTFNEPSGNIKLAAGWLIEQCGWKGKRIGDVAVHEKQALVLVNYGKATGKDIFDLSEKIKQSVFEKFGIELEREVEVIGTI